MQEVPDVEQPGSVLQDGRDAVSGRRGDGADRDGMGGGASGAGVSELERMAGKDVFKSSDSDLPSDIRSCTECRMQPISAEIAEKLGIRPKEIDE